MTPQGYFGKYRGKVDKNKDPLNLGRIQPTVPAISPDVLNWAMPCTPYAGPRVGLFAIPPVGANVWIEFEGGDPNYPIWTGCFWGATDAEKPPRAATSPDQKVFQSEKIQVIMDDQATRLTGKLKSAKETGNPDTMSIVMDEKGIIVTAKKVTATFTPTSIDLKMPPSAKVADIKMTANSIKLTLPPAFIEITSKIELSNVQSSAEISAASVNLASGSSTISMSGAVVPHVSVNGGALEVT